MRAKRKVNLDTVVVGSSEWKSLSQRQRAEVQAKRAGGYIGKVVTPEVWDIDDIPEEEPPELVRDMQPKYKAVVRHLTAEEFDALPAVEKQTWKGNPPEYAPQDDMPGDRSVPVFTPGAVVTAEKERDGYTLQRKQPHGFWYILGLEADLGSFTGFNQAHEALLEYLKGQS
jgi:hypothetical protein